MSTDSSPYCRYCNYSSRNDYRCNPTGPDVCQPCKKLAQIEEQVQSIRLMLVGLESERQKLKMQANQHHDQLIHRFPPEIAAEIFQQSVTDYSYDSLSISAVCKRWRDMAFSVPRLWQSLRLQFTKALPRQSPPRCLLTQEWIDQARGLPISISLSVDADYFRRHDVSAVIGVLNQYSTHWVELHCKGRYFWKAIRVRGCVYEYINLPNDDREFPQLRTLRLDNISNNGNMARLSLRLQGLKVFSCSAIYLDSFVGGTHLTELRMDEFDPPTLLVILRIAHNLKTCILGEPQAATSVESDPLSNRSIHHNLETLAITVSFAEIVFQQIRCPSLKSLTFDTDYFNPLIRPDDIPLLVGFLQQSHCSLEYLFVWDTTGFSDTDIDLICQNIPTLQDLSIVSHDPDSADIVATSLEQNLNQFITDDDEMQPLYLPALASLSLDLSDTSEAHRAWWIIPSIFGYCPNPEGQPEYYRHVLTEMTVSPSQGIMASNDVSCIQALRLLQSAGVRLDI